MNEATLKGIREMAAKSVYPFTLAFTREFTAGTLAGLTHDDKCGFCSEADACEWVSEINAKNRAGKLDYKVIFFVVIRG